MWWNVLNYISLRISKPKFWWSANSYYVFYLSSSIIWSVLCRSEGAPIRRLSAQGTPIGPPGGRSHSNKGNMGSYLSYELAIWEMWANFAAHEPKPRVSCSTRTEIEQKYHILHKISLVYCTTETLLCILHWPRSLSIQWANSHQKRSEWGWVLAQNSHFLAGSGTSPQWHVH